MCVSFPEAVFCHINLEKGQRLKSSSVLNGNRWGGTRNGQRPEECTSFRSASTRKGMPTLPFSKVTGKWCLFILQRQLQILLEKLATRGSLCSKSWHVMLKNLQTGQKKEGEREEGRILKLGIKMKHKDSGIASAPCHPPYSTTSCWSCTLNKMAPFWRRKWSCCKMHYQV